MDSNHHHPRYDAGDRYQQQPQPPYNGVPTYTKNNYLVEHSEPLAPPPMEKPNSSGSFGRTPTAHDEHIQPTEAEINLLRKLRTLQGGDYEAQYFDNKPNPNKKSLLEKIGNPTPLAVACFGLTNTLMSLFLMNVRGLHELTFLSPVMWFTAGLTNFVVGILELLIGNTFAYVIFGSLGGYFLSLGAILTPPFGIIEEYKHIQEKGNPAKGIKPDPYKGAKELRNALGVFNLCWAAMFVMFLIVSTRANVFMVFIFGCVAVTCVLSAIGDFQWADGHFERKQTFDKIAGVFLLLSSIPNWYMLFMMLVYSAGWKIKLYTGELGAHKAAAHAHKTE